MPKLSQNDSQNGCPRGFTSLQAAYPEVVGFESQKLNIHVFDYPMRRPQWYMVVGHLGNTAFSHKR
jgi:hypothetical protein